MPLSLHAALVPSWLQILGAGRGWLDKATAHGMGEAELSDARLIEDMVESQEKMARELRELSVRLEALEERLERIERP